MLNVVNQYKFFFFFLLEIQTNPELFQIVSSYIGVAYKFILKSAKGLNRIFWVIEYC